MISGWQDLCDAACRFRCWSYRKARTEEAVITYRITDGTLTVINEILAVALLATGPLK
jgi:hypothetical protein